MSGAASATSPTSPAAVLRRWVAASPQDRETAKPPITFRGRASLRTGEAGWCDAPIRVDLAGSDEDPGQGEHGATGYLPLGEREPSMEAAWLGGRGWSGCDERLLRWPWRRCWRPPGRWSDRLLGRPRPTEPTGSISTVTASTTWPLASPPRGGWGGPGRCGQHPQWRRRWAGRDRPDPGQSRAGRPVRLRGRQGDFNADGFTDLAVGAPSEDVGTAGLAGAVNVFYGSVNGLPATSQVRLQSNRRTATGSAPRLTLACSTTTTSWTWLSAPLENRRWPGRRRGRECVLWLGWGLPATSQTLLQGKPEQGDRFGAALVAGFFNADQGDLAVGAPGEDVGSAGGAGPVSVFSGTPGGLPTSSRGAPPGQPRGRRPVRVGAGGRVLQRQQL